MSYLEDENAAFSLALLDMILDKNGAKKIPLGSACNEAIGEGERGFLRLPPRTRSGWSLGNTEGSILK